MAFLRPNQLKLRYQPGFLAFGLLTFAIFWSSNTAKGQTPQPTPLLTGAAATSLNPLTAEQEIQILDAIDAKSNSLDSITSTNTTQPATQVTGLSPSGTPTSNAQVQSPISNVTGTSNPSAASLSSGTTPTIVESGPPPVPSGLTVLILKEGLYLSWDSAPVTSSVTAYNVYRSTTPGMGYKLVNNKPLNVPFFLDGAQNSLNPPRNGEDYFYVVASINAKGDVSPYSDETTVQPQGMDIPETEEQKKEDERAQATPPPHKETEKELIVPESKIINLQLPADTQLSIQGYKKIEAGFTFQKYDRPALNGINPEVDTTLVNQELVVNLDGKVGKNVDVHVDYSDVNRAGGVDQSKQEISIVYHGNDNSPVQEVSFGDLQLNLPNTEFAGFSKQLFGLQAKLKFDQFRFTTFFAQTKGISETKVFTGNTVQVDKVINDVDFLRYKYFLITKGPNLPKNSSEQIWVNAGTGLTNPTGTTNFIGPYEHWLPGRDYTINYATGVITFLRALTQNAQVVVAFQDTNGNYIGFLPDHTTVDGLNTGGVTTNLVVPPDGVITNSAHLLKNNDTTTSPLNLVNYFDLGRDQFIPPQQDPDFLFQIIDQGTNNVLQTGQGGTASAPWAYVMDQDLNILTVNNINYSAVTVAGLNGSPVTANFEERAFVAPGDTTLGTATNGIYNLNTTPNSLYRIHLKYKTKLNFFNLERFNIIRGSDTVYLDGRHLRRDVDYTFDYTSGVLDFPDKSILRPDSQIVVTYEYAPFGSFNQNNILGARAEYDITDHFFLGGTFLNSTTQQTVDVPQIGSTPNSLSVIDFDTKYDLGPEDIQSVTGLLPGLGNWKPPLAIKLSGEVAESYFNPDTFDAEGETGVAMVDNMEGIDNLTGPTMNATNWVVSSEPDSVSYLNSVTYYAGKDALLNNRVRFMSVDDSYYLQTLATNSNTAVTQIGGFGGHVYSQTNAAQDLVPVLMFPYNSLDDLHWAGVRQVLSTTGEDLSNTQYIQSWVYNDGNDKWIMFDFGIINESSNDNDNGGIIESDAVSVININGNQISTDWGIPAYYSNIGNGPGVNILPPVCGSNAVYTYYPNESSTQEGARNGIVDTEDMNGDGILENDNSYFEYGVRANWTGWHLIKIPVNFNSTTDYQTTTPDGINYFFHNQGAANATIIRAARVWTTGTTPNPTSGYFLMESFSFTRNLWQMEVDPDANVDQGVTVNPSKFDASSISQDQDSGYQPTLRFLTVAQDQNQNSILAKEKSLKLSYNVSSVDYEPAGDINGKPIYYATRYFSQGVDFTDFHDLRFDIFARTSVQPGDTLFIRLGNDQKNYYQYNIPLLSSYQNLWNTVSIAIDGSGGNRQVVGTPFVNRSSQISIGVVNPNAPNGQTREIWINNLRVATPNQRSGLARRANAAIILGDNFATINGRYREVDSGFTEMDQTSTHFQHSKQLGADYSSSAIKLFSQPLVTQFSYTHQNTYTEQGLLDNPYFSALPDTDVQNATGSISYTKDLGPGFGRLTKVVVSGSTNYETDNYQSAYLTQPGIQGDTNKGEDVSRWLPLTTLPGS